MKRSVILIIICVLGFLFRAHADEGVSDAGLSGKELQALLIADHFDVDLPMEVYLSQSDRLNRNWFERFRVRSDLQAKSIVTFLVTYPDQLVPVRDYLQQLINADVIEYQTVIRILELALNQISSRYPTSHIQSGGDQTPLPDPASLRYRSFTKSSEDTIQLIRKKSPPKFITRSDNARLTIESGDGRPTYEISYLKAFDQDGVSSEFPYFQVDLHKNTSPYLVKERVSLGIGYRGVSLNDQIMFGVNLFHDWDVDNHHRRGSIGFTVDSSPVKIIGHRYVGLSNHDYESTVNWREVLDGSSIGAKIQVPYLSNTYLSYDKFWVTDSDIENLSGNERGVHTQLSDHISLELSEIRWDSQVSQDEYRAKLKFHWLPVDRSSTSESMFSESGLGLGRYAIVERDPILFKTGYEVFSSSNSIEEVVQEEVVQEEVVQEEVIQEEVVQEEVVQEEVVQEEVIQEEVVQEEVVQEGYTVTFNKL